MYMAEEREGERERDGEMEREKEMERRREREADLLLLFNWHVAGRVKGQRWGWEWLASLE